MRGKGFVNALVERQREKHPCHEWGLGNVSESSGWASYRTVGNMSTDLFKLTSGPCGFGGIARGMGTSPLHSCGR